MGFAGTCLWQGRRHAYAESAIRLYRCRIAPARRRLRSFLPHRFPAPSEADVRTHRSRFRAEQLSEPLNHIPTGGQYNMTLQRFTAGRPCPALVLGLALLLGAGTAFTQELTGNDLRRGHGRSGARNPGRHGDPHQSVAHPDRDPRDRGPGRLPRPAPLAGHLHGDGGARGVPDRHVRGRGAERRERHRARRHPVPLRGRRDGDRHRRSASRGRQEQPGDAHHGRGPDREHPAGAYLFGPAGLDAGRPRQRVLVHAHADRPREFAPRQPVQHRRGGHERHHRRLHLHRDPDRQ